MHSLHLLLLASLALTFLGGCSCATTHVLDDAGLGDAAGRPDAAVSFADAEHADAAPGDAFVTPPSDLAPCEALGDDQIAATAVSPDGALYAIAAFDTVRLLDAGTGALVRTLGETSARSGSASASAFHPDGTRLFLGHSDGIRELALDDGRTLRTIPVARGCCGVSHVAFAPSAGVALAYSEGFRVIDLSSGAVRDLSLSGPVVDGFDVSPDGTLGAFIDPEGVLLVRLVDGALDERIAFRGAETARFSPDGSRLAITSRETRSEIRNLVSVVRLRSPGPTATFDALPSTLLRFPLAWSPDGSRLHVAVEQEILDLVVSSDGSSLTVAARRPSPIDDAYTLDVGPDGQVFAARDHAASIAPDGALRWLRAASTSQAGRREIAFDARGNLLADGVLWDVTTDLAVRVLDPHQGRASLDAEGRALAWIADGFANVEIDGALVAHFRATTDPDATREAESIAIDEGTVLLATQTEVVVLARGTGLPIGGAPIAARSRVVLLERSADGLHLLMGWREDPPQLISLLGGRDDTPSELASRGVVRGPDATHFLPDGRIAAALYPTRTLRVHSLDDTLEEIPAVPLVRAIALGRTGELAALRLDGVSLHDGANFDELMFLDAGDPSAPEQAIAMSPEGTRVAWTSRRRIEIACVDRE